MRKIILLITIFICIFQVEAFADTEFIRGNAPKIEETRIDTADNFFYLELSSQMQRYIKINFKRRFPVQAFAWTLI